MKTILCIAFIAICTGNVAGITRRYYIAAVERIWDYMPTSDNILPSLQAAADLYTVQDTSLSNPRIGKEYLKAIYREFTDDTFLVEKTPPPWQGLIGPIIHAETGDIVEVHFKNDASRPYSIHPHGIKYEKRYEGALYADGTLVGTEDKSDDAVPPGQTQLYIWNLTANYGPVPGDPNCLTWVYHSHNMAEIEISSGLVGAILTCSAGIIDEQNNRLDVDKEIILYVHVIDENESFYARDNAKRVFPTATEAEIDGILSDSGFQLGGMKTHMTGIEQVGGHLMVCPLVTLGNVIKVIAMLTLMLWTLNTVCYFHSSKPQAVTGLLTHLDYNMMHVINGFVFASLPGLDICVDDIVDIHFIGLGGSVDMHSLYFEGLSVVINNHRSDLASLFASIFFTAQLTVPRPLKSFLSCHVYEHFQAGLGAFLNVNDCSGTYVPSPAIPTNTRTFYIGAVEKIWDYGPTGLNAFTGETLLNDPASKPYFSTENKHIGGQYYKALFREFTDSSFIQEAPHQQHLGILGPPIYAEFGENIQIIFKNLVDFDVTLTPHGVYNYNLTDNLDVSGVIHPDETSTLLWYIDPAMGPSSFDENCLSRPYSSYATPNDVYAGLLGVLILCLPGGLKPSGRGIAGVDREFFLHLSEMNENLSPYLQKNIDTFCEDPLNVVQDGAFKDSNTLQAINGYVFGNLPGLSMCNGDKIKWHVLSTGAQFDVHMPFFHGRTLTYKDGHKDTLSLFPSLTKSVDMVADNPGTWEIGCHSFDRWQEGMRAQLQITNCPGKVVPAPRRGTRATIRTYYIAAVEREWNFAPVNSLHPVSLLPLSEDPESSIFYNRDAKHIGRVYKKALFREFTDATFTVEKDRNSDGTVHLGVLGPRIHAESGDTLVVVFKNMAATQSYNFFTHGVQYPTSAEEPYTKNPVSPGETVRYTLQIPDNSGPGNSDYNCTSWLYYSAVDPIRDSMSGLFGTLVTCKPGILNAAGQRTDVDRELTILFANLDENQSWYIDENVQTYCNYSDGEPKVGDFYFSNLKFSVNGRIFANNEQLDMVVGQKVAIHMIGIGGIGDTHTMHFHGQTVTLRDYVDHRNDAFAFFPAGSTSVQMSPDNPGTWLIHCHLHSHIRNGMVTTYTVFPSPGP